MFDITNKESFSDLPSLWIRLVKESIYPKVLPSNKHLLIVGNKADLEVDRKVQKTDAEAFAEEIGAAGYFETSAKTGLNVDGLLEHCRTLQFSE